MYPEQLGLVLLTLAAIGVGVYVACPGFFDPLTCERFAGCARGRYGYPYRSR